MAERGGLAVWRACVARTFVQFKGGPSFEDHGDIWINPDHVLYVRDHPQGALLTFMGQMPYDDPTQTSPPLLTLHTVLVIDEDARAVVAKLQQA